MNVIIENIMTRRSCRKYKAQSVPKELIAQVAAAGTWAPTGRGRQSPLIVAVTDKPTRDRLSAMNAAIMGVGSDPFYGAPVVLVVLADRTIPTHIYDGSLVMGAMMLAAHSLGLGSCWIHRAREEFAGEEGQNLLRAWGIEGDYEGIGHCILGYPEGAPAEPAPRKQDYVRFV